MSAKNTSATILIRDNTRLPTGLALDSESFLPGWRAVQNLDGRKLGRKIEEAHWNFFFLAGAIRTTVLGREGLGTFRRAVNRILAKQKGLSFNSLEITKVVSRRFLGVPYLSMSAHSRHIQEGMYLVPAENFRIGHAAGVSPPPAAALVFGEQ
jgi:hypothetical protein